MDQTDVRERGKFITFEGGEGSGKSTQVAILANWLREQGIDAVTTREPGGSPGAESIRTLLVEGAIDRWQPMSEVLLHNAARAEHLANTVLPALEKGSWVISDRYADSTMAYQGYGHQLDTSVIGNIQQNVIGDSVPDLTLVLDLPADTGLERVGKRHGPEKEDRYERMGTAFHERVRQGFIDIARNAAERCEIVDAFRSQEKVAQAIRDTVAKRLKVYP